jgi:hypothetical protein
LFVYGVLVTAGLMVWSYVAEAVAGTIRWQDAVRNLANRLASSNWLGLLLQTWWRHKWLAAWLVVTFWIGLRVDSHLDRKYSEFWHRDDLRLKLRRLIGLG